MPELPEVETTRRGICTALIDASIANVIVRQKQLRWPVPVRQLRGLIGARITGVSRRAKYLIISTQQGHIIVHLGMSGYLRVLTQQQAINTHDHVDLVLANNTIIRYNDPRRFGAWLFTPDNPLAHPRLSHLGPEPLDRVFNTQYLYQLCQTRQTNIKTLIMDQAVVVGVGNIYATESLFMASILPTRPANSLKLNEVKLLVQAIKKILKQAIKRGGTTLKDFQQPDSKPGYFSTQLAVYGREHEPCYQCQEPLLHIKLNGRATVYCQHCQF